MFGFLRLITHPEERRTTISKKACVREAKSMRKNMSEKGIDKTLENSFPASDPPGWY